MKRILFTVLVFSAVFCRADTLWMPSVFSDHMVLQRDAVVPVWGTAEAGATVTVEFSGQKKETVASDSGKWQVELDPMPASSQSRVLQVSSLPVATLPAVASRQPLPSAVKFQVSFSDVLIGEVWLCSGQSNMEWALEKTEDAEAAIAAATNSLIRLYHTPRLAGRIPAESVDARWKACSPETIRDFSGVAYYFGEKLVGELNVPIGLLQSAWGGTRILPWTPPEGMEEIDSLKEALETARNVPPMSGDSRQDRHIPTVLYNGMIHPHIPFPIRGVIWYQGEANAGQGALYTDKSRALINGWRQLWGYEFPFYFVQIAPYQYGNSDPHIIPRFCEAQANIVKTVPKTGMAVVSDVATPDNIHPPNKKVPGTRLALLALDKTYGKEVVSTGPTFKEMMCHGNAIEIQFDSAEGLKTRDGKSPDWFEIAGKDKEFKKASAEIQGTSVRLSSEEVPHPVAVRFAWHKLAQPNLINGAGIPAGACRAGDVSY
jgi:hypothetical protein